MRLGIREIAVLVCLLGPGVACSQSISGAMLGDTCAGCHGTQGAAVNVTIPPLAGMNAEQFVATMLAYRTGKQSGTIMNRVARAYSDEEINAMAEYFASFPTSTSK